MRLTTPSFCLALLELILCCCHYVLQGEERASIIAHSYGTLVASSLAKRHATLVSAGLTLIDPVCFAMFLPHLVRKTLHFESVSSGKKPASWGDSAASANGGNAPAEPATSGSLFSRWFPIRNLMKGEREFLPLSIFPHKLNRIPQVELQGCLPYQCP